MLLQGKVVLVTGAGRGIGAAVARACAAEGATVAVHYRHSRQEAEALATEVGGGAEPFQADLVSEQESVQLVEAVRAAYGRIDVLVNNAASFRHDVPYDQAMLADYVQEFLGVVGVTVNVTKAVIPAMISAGGGRIINFAATLVDRPAPQHIVHTTAKSALIGYSRTLAKQLGPFHINVNVVSPGMTMTEYSQNMPAAAADAVRSQTPLRKLAQPEDVASTVVFLASPLSSMLSGAILSPDGGLVDTA